MARKPALIFLNNRAYRVRVPTGLDGENGTLSEWDTILSCVGTSDTFFHWSFIWSWCQDPFCETNWPETTVESFMPPTHRALRGCTSARAMNTADYDTRGSYIGFRPILEPVEPDTLAPDPTRLADIRDGAILPLGTLYMNGKPIRIPHYPTREGDIPDYKSGADLRIGQTHEEAAYQMRMIKCGHLLISDRNLIKNISWNDLDRCGLIYGEQSRTKPPKEADRPRSPSLPKFPFSKGK